MKKLINYGSIGLLSVPFAEDTTVEMLNKRDDGAKMVYSQ